jgi:hypothetical protein
LNNINTLKKMKLTIEINMDNAAFEPNNGTEAARVLRELADVIDDKSVSQSFEMQALRDVNGNRVGEAKVSHEKSAYPAGRWTLKTSAALRDQDMKAGGL